MIAQQICSNVLCAVEDNIGVLLSPLQYESVEETSVTDGHLQTIPQGLYIRDGHKLE